MHVIAVAPYELNNKINYNIITTEQPTILYEELPDGSYIGRDPSNIFYKFFGKSKSKGAFNGRPVTITTIHGEVIELKDYWWDGMIPNDILPPNQRTDANVMGLKGKGSMFSPTPLTIDIQKLTDILLTEDVDIVKSINEFLKRR